VRPWKGVILRDWKDPENRRKFFEDFARENNFDPLIPENWQSRYESIISEKVTYFE
jgi:hypothetical protein